ncbi:serine--tRNA ligase [bacterium]|nr:serine--tRNA ligase [bacterium]
MLDLKFIRNNVELVKKACRNKNDKADIDRIIALDQYRREIIQELDHLRGQGNKLSAMISEMIRKEEDISDLKAEAKNISERAKVLNEDLKSYQTELDQLLLTVPNIPHPEVPVGRDESANREIRSWGAPPEFDFEPRDHLWLGEVLGMLDLGRGAKIAGSFFPLYTNDGAQLKRALVNFMIEIHTTEHGYREVSPPFLSNRDCMVGTGQLPKLANDMYLIPTEDLFLIPTGEVPVTNLYREEVIPEEQLPLKFVTCTPCFRREAGAYGKDTRGLMRVHQFDKVELVKFVHPENSYQEHEELLHDAEVILQKLGLHYRVQLLATGDLSFAGAKCYDLEVWAPGIRKYLEVSSCTIFEDFQARRANIKFKPRGSGKLDYVHTMNASGLALPRLIIAFMETYQSAVGKIWVPPILRSFLNGKEFLG